MDVVTDDRRQLGRWGEQRAVELLESKGFRILARNWHCAVGELDIVAAGVEDTGAEVIVFCEVKCRRGLAWGHPLEAITPRKVQRLRRLAGHWLAAHPQGIRRLRLDAIGVLQIAGQPVRCDHIEGLDR